MTSLMASSVHFNSPMTCSLEIVVNSLWSLKKQSHGQLNHFCNKRRDVLPSMNTNFMAFIISLFENVRASNNLFTNNKEGNLDINCLQISQQIFSNFIRPIIKTLIIKVTKFVNNLEASSKKQTFLPFPKFLGLCNEQCLQA